MREVFRKISRNKTRYFIVIFLFALSISMISIVSNIEASSITYSELVMKKYSLADIVIYTDFELNYSVVNDIKEMDGVEDVSLDITYWGYGIINETYVVIRLYGLSKNMTLNKPIIYEENWSNFKGNVCFIDRIMAERLNLTIGDKIKVYTDNGTIELEIIDFVDAQWTLSISIPRVLYLFMPVETLKSFLKVDGYNILFIRTNNKVDKVALANDIISTLEEKGIKVHGKSIIISGNRSSLSSISIIFGIFMIPTTILSAILLAVTLLYEIIKDFRHYGVMKAIGYTGKQIAFQVYKEAIALYVISIPLAVILSLIITKIAIDLVITPWIGEIPTVINWYGFLMSLIINLGVLLIFALYPALKAAKIREADAIRWGFERSKEVVKDSKSGFILPVSLRFAYRNLFRTKKKTALILIMLIIGSSLTFSILTMSASVSHSLSNCLNDNSDIVLHLGSPTSYENISRLANISGIESFDPAIIEWVSVDNISIAVGEYNGTPPALLTRYYSIFFVPPKRNTFNPNVLEGRLPCREDEVAILAKLALYLGLKVGEIIEIKINTLNVSATFRIVGIVNEMYSNGAGFIFTDDIAFNSFYPENHYNTVFIKLKKGAKISNIIDEISRMNLDVKTVVLMEGLRENMKILLVNAVVSFLTLISILTSLIVIVGLSSFFFMSYIHRLREIALYQALGASMKDISKIVISEGLIIYLVTLLPIMVLSYIMSVQFVNLMNKIEIPIYGIVNLAISDFILMALLPLAMIFASLPITIVYISKQNLVNVIKNY